MFPSLTAGKNWRGTTLVEICCFVLPFFVAIATADGELPQTRPALIGSMKSSLVNLIDTQALMRKGFDHGAVYFGVGITPSGATYKRLAYGGTPGSDELRHEVRRQLPNARFIPPVYNHHYTYGSLYGTITFAVIDGKPHLRVYANQDKNEVAQGNDFVAPQAIFILNHRYDQIAYPSGTRESAERPATVDIELSVDAMGNLRDVRALREDPPGQKFGETALKITRNCTYLPAFRNGRPVDSITHYIFTYVPANYMFKP